METFDSVKKYLKPSAGHIAVGAFFLILGAATVFGLLREGIAYIVIGAVMLLLGGWLAGAAISERLKFKKLCDDIADSSECGEVISEFSEPELSPKEDLKLGSSHIFAKKSGLFLKYEDVLNLYIYIHKTNGIEDRRELRAKTAERIVTLVKLKNGGKQDSVAEEIVAFMREKNPAITVGYNK